METKTFNAITYSLIGLELLMVACFGAYFIAFTYKGNFSPETLVPMFLFIVFVGMMALVLNAVIMHLLRRRK